MTGETVIATYSISEPFESALKLIRAELARAGPRVLGELDISGTIQRILGIGIAPCKVLFVCTQQLILKATNVRPAVRFFLPLHILVSARDEQTEIHLLASLPPASDNRVAAPAAIVNTSGTRSHELY